MAPSYQSTSIAVLTTHAYDVTSPTALPATLTSTRNDPSRESSRFPSTSIISAPSTAYFEHNLGVTNNSCKTPPPPPHYGESSFDLVDGDSSPPYADDSPLLPMSHGLQPDKSADGIWLLIGLPEASRSSQRLGDSQYKTSLAQAPALISCSTTWTLGSSGLNYHVNPDNDMYRWQKAGIPIPVGIDMSSFESTEQRRMIKACLVTVLYKFTASNVGPEFHYVAEPSHSAFFVRFGGDHPLYAHSFFPGSHPKDWYIDVFKPSFTLSEDQEQFLVDTTRGDISVARKEALERNLINILTHEMLHVVGVRHCDAQLAEMERCVRFPPNLSDDENNEELLMKPTLDWRSLRELRWLSRTIQEIQQIYAMKVGESIGGHRIQDVSWQVGAKQRKEIALRNARCCVG